LTSRSDVQGPPPRPPTTDGIALVERAILLVLLALIPLRALLNETLNFEVMRMFRDLPAPPSAQPATTFLIIAVIIACAAVLAVVRLWRGGPRYRWTGAELGAGLLAIAAALSTWRAGQKHLALIGSLDFLALVAYLLTLRQVVTRPWHLRLALAVVLGTGAMVVVKCGYQQFIEFPETIAYYEREYQASVGHIPTGQPGGAAESGLKYDYEQRLLSQLVSGYFGHSNVLGSYLVLVVMAGIGLAAARYRRRSGGTLLTPLLIAAGGLATLVAARSKGAVAACGIALLLWVLGQWGIPRWIRASLRRHLWIALWLGLLATGSLVVGAVRARPDVLGRSMLYRHLYWQGAADMIRDQGPLGVGPNNFGRHFPRYKPAECPEEVASPHSWVVEFAAEWGLLGLAGVLVMFIGVSRRLAAPRALREGEAPAELRASASAAPTGETPVPPNEEPRPSGRAVPPSEPWPSASAVRDSRHERHGPGADIEATPGPRSGALAARLVAATVGADGGSVILWTAGIGAIAFGWQGLVLAGANPWFRAMSIAIAATPWVIGALAAAIESRESTTFADDPPGPMSAAIVAGLVGFLLHTGIDLAMFHGGAAITFFALIAVVLAARGEGEAPAEPSRAAPESLSEPKPRPGLARALCRALFGEASIVHSTPNCCSGGPLARLAAAVVGLGAAAGIVLLMTVLVLPAARLADDLHQARLNSKPSTWDVYAASRGHAAYVRGIDAYPLDGAAVEELLDELTPRLTSIENVDAALRLAAEFQRRDPDNSIVWHDLAVLHYRRFELGRDPADMEQAVAAMGAAVAAYPTSPAKRLMLGDMLERQAAVTNSAELRRAAAAQYEKALDLDAQSVYISKPHRFSGDLRAKIAARAAALRAGNP
jgi:hypothetical protein